MSPGADTVIAERGRYLYASGALRGEILRRSSKVWSWRLWSVFGEETQAKGLCPTRKQCYAELERECHLRCIA